MARASTYALLLAVLGNAVLSTLPVPAMATVGVHQSPLMAVTAPVRTTGNAQEVAVPPPAAAVAVFDDRTCGKLPSLQSYATDVKNATHTPGVTAVDACLLAHVSATMSTATGRLAGIGSIVAGHPSRSPFKAATAARHAAKALTVNRLARRHTCGSLQSHAKNTAHTPGVTTADAPLLVLKSTTVLTASGLSTMYPVPAMPHLIAVAGMRCAAPAWYRDQNKDTVTPAAVPGVALNGGSRFAAVPHPADDGRPTAPPTDAHPPNWHAAATVTDNNTNGVSPSIVVGGESTAVCGVPEHRFSGTPASPCLQDNFASTAADIDAAASFSRGSVDARLCVSCPHCAATMRTSAFLDTTLLPTTALSTVCRDAGSSDSASVHVSVSDSGFSLPPVGHAPRVCTTDRFGLTPPSLSKPPRGAPTKSLPRRLTPSVVFAATTNTTPRPHLQRSTSPEECFHLVNTSLRFIRGPTGTSTSRWCPSSLSLFSPACAAPGCANTISVRQKCVTKPKLWGLDPASGAIPRSVPGTPLVGATRRPVQLVALMLVLVALSSSSTPQRRGMHPSLLRILLGLCLVWAVSASSPTCARLNAPPNAEVVTLCAPRWPRTPTAAPAAGTSVAIDVSLASSVAGLSLVSAEVNGVDVGASFSEGGGGLYSVTYTTVAGDENWPWMGLNVGIVLNDGGSLVADISAALVPGTTWSEESSARGMAALDRDDGFGVCMGDVDGDGDVDVFAAMATGTVSQLWINDGSGVFANEAVARGLAGDASGNAYGCGFGDADGDGLVDLVVTRFTAPVTDLYMNAGGTFVEDGVARGVNVGDDSVGVSWGDVDGDGDIDLFVCSSHDKRNRLFMNDGAGVFSEEAVSRGVGTLARHSRQSVLVDIDGDGDLDALVVNTGQANELYLNAGDGTFAEAGLSRGFDDASNGHGLSVGDWSGDGMVDVYVTSYNSRDLLLLNDGSGVFSEMGVGAGIGASTGASTGLVMFDLEDDGDVDVVVGVDSSTNLVWLNDGTGTFVEASADLAFSGTAARLCVAAGDIDGDSDVDVIMGRSGGVYVSHAAQAGLSRSMVVRPLTARGAQSAFGSTVRVVCVDGCESEWSALRVIDGGSGQYSQSGYDAVVGVPIPTATYNVSVRWPADFHPQSNWATHPILGGIQPSTLTLPPDRLFIVRPEPVTLSVSASPWDYPGVTDRAGQGAGGPVAGDAVSVNLTLSSAVQGVSLVTVNGADVTDTLSGSGRQYTVTYATQDGDEDWPWNGLSVSVAIDAGSTQLSSMLIPGTMWSEESDTRGLAVLANSLGRGVCMGDVDGDGDIDTFVAMLDGAENQLWMNDGSGHFTNQAELWGVKGELSWRSYACGLADVDGDGLLDLFVTRFESSRNLLFMNTGHAFTDVSASSGVQSASLTSSRGFAWGDIDQDGDVDLYVSDLDVANMLFINNGAGSFSEEASPRNVAHGASSSDAALADIDGDGDLDLIVVGVSFVSTNVGGQGTFFLGSHGLDGVSAGFVAVGDWNGDGAFDLFLGVYSSTTRNRLFVNDGSGFFSEVGVSAGLGALAANSVGAISVDIEDDGDLDLVVASRAGYNQVWANRGAGAFDALVESVGGWADGVACGDIDGDGDVDLMMSGSGHVFVSHTARPGVQRAVIVRPLTAAGAPSAFGATLRVECARGCSTPWAAVRVLGASSWLSQSEYDAHVGVPVPFAMYNISVRWPGDAHPLSTWTSHLRLGGVVPAGLASPSDRLFVVRPHPVGLSVAVLVWDYPGVAARGGLAASAPVADDAVLVPIVLSPAQGAHDISVLSATVNGEDVSATWSVSSTPGTYTLTYTTVAGDELWPWTGLEIEVHVVDSGGLESAVSHTVVPGTTWSEESDTRGMAALDNDKVRGVCMGDVDGDGDVDVFAALISGSANQLWINDGSGNFVDEAAARGVAGDSSDAAVGCGFGDADGDGWVDLVVTRHTDNMIELYMNGGGGTFVEDGVARGVSAGDGAWCVSWGDVDGDGNVDLLVCGQNGGRNMLFMNDGSGVFSEDGVSRGVATLARPSHQSALVDIDGDGDLDVLVVNDGQANELYVNGGGGSFVEAGGPRGFADASAARGVSVGDWSGDGMVDVYVANRGSRDLLLLNDGSGVFTEVGVGAGIGASTGNSHGVVMLDAENDGDVDVIVGVSVGTDLVWVNDGSGGFVEAGAVLPLGSTLTTYAVGAGDIDGDGDVDVVVGYRSGDVYVSHAAQPGVSRSIVVRPLTAAGAQSAFGASVRVECEGGCAKDWVGLRVIDGGSSMFSQSAYDAVVGVPFPSASYNISVRWPGDAHPQSNWASHPRLGAVVPSTLTSTEARLFIVRTQPLVLSAVAPWDYPGETSRPGLGAALPAAGDTAAVVIIMPPPAIHDLLHLSSAFVGGVDVSHTWTPTASPNTFTLTHTTVDGEEMWPWAGLAVDITVVDSGGLASTLSTTVVSGSTYEEDSAARGGLSGLAAPAGRGVCVGDVDGDGDVDVFVALDAGGLNQLWINDGSGVFAEAAGAWGVAGSSSDDATHGCAFGDADGDGLLDLLVALWIGDANALYMNAGGSFVEDGSARGVATGVDDSIGVVWGDVDGDGDVDALVSAQGPNLLYMNDGGGVFTSEAGSRGAGSSHDCFQSVLVDVDGDGDLDALVVNGGGSPNELFVNDGSGGFVEDGAPRGFNDAGSGVGIAVGDLDGDGLVDVLVTTAVGFDLLYMNAGDGVFEEVGANVGLTVAVGSSQGVALFDVDGDSDVDAVIGVTNGDTVVWLNAGGVFLSAGSEFNVGATSAIAVCGADIDGDGDVDVVQSRSGALSVGHNARPSLPNAFAVRPLTAAGGQSAFGATVRVVCVAGCGTDWVGTRWVSGGEGLYSQPGYDAVVVVPVPTASHNISVRWPGDVHPVSNWASHPNLGDVVPSADVHLFVVRPAPVTVVVGEVLPPWDYPGVSARNGLLPDVPAAGSTLTLPVVMPESNVNDLSVVAATVNGQDVAPTFTRTGQSAYSLTYTVPSGDTLWPWTGLAVDVQVVDSSGLLSQYAGLIVTGSTFKSDGVLRGVPSVTTAAALADMFCAGDVDGDAFADMFVAVPGEANQLWVNDGSGNFVDDAAAWGVDGGAADTSIACAFGDVNGDGLLDLWVGLEDGNQLYIRNAGPGFTEQASARGLTDTDTAVRRGLLFDCDGDRDLDLYVMKTVAGVNLMYVNNGAGGFDQDASNRNVDSNANTRGGCVFDVDNDGALDMAVVVHYDTGNLLYVNTGDGLFQQEATARGFNKFDAHRDVVAVDINGDGWVDVVTAVLDADSVYLNDAGVLVEQAGGAGAGSSKRSFTLAAFDAQLDGHIDLLFLNDDGAEGGGEVFSVNAGRGSRFYDYAALLGFTGTTDRWAVSVFDIDNDGDEDVFEHPGGLLYVNYNAQVGVHNWVKVYVLSRAGALGVVGATVKVECVTLCPKPWLSARVVHDAMPVHVGFPPDAVSAGAAYDVSVTYPSGAVQSPANDASLAAIIPSPSTRLIQVYDRPYFTAVSVTSAPGGVGVGATVEVELTAGQLRTGLVAATDASLCCYVNGVQVRDTLTDTGSGRYTLTYTVGAADPSWNSGELPVRAALEDPVVGLAAIDVTASVVGSPPGDTVAPSVVVECGPGVYGTLSWQPICLTCPAEDVASSSGCSFMYTVDVPGRLPADTPHALPAGNMTSATSGTLWVGQLLHDDAVEVRVWAVDVPAGNTGDTVAIDFDVDLISPVTTITSGPPAVSPSTGAFLTLSCSESECSFEYQLNGAVWTSLGANGTASGDAPVADTVLLLGPPLVSNITTPSFLFNVTGTTPDSAVNTTVVLEVGDWQRRVPVPMAEALVVPPLPDGEYTATAIGYGGDGTFDVTPVVVRFIIDTQPPVVSVLRAPADGDDAKAVVVASSEVDCAFIWREGPDGDIGTAAWQVTTVGGLRLGDVEGGIRHAVEVFAVDAAGNHGDVVTVVWTPAACPPGGDIPAVAVVKDAFIGDSMRYVVFEADADWEAFEYSLNGGDWVPTAASSVWLEGGLVPGATHTVDIRAAVPSVCSTAVASSRPPPASVTWTEQALPPLTVTISTQLQPSTASVFGAFELSVARRLAALEYQVDGEAWTPCGPSLRIGPLQPGSHELRARAVVGDSIGPEESFVWIVTSAEASTVVAVGLEEGLQTVHVRATDIAGRVENEVVVYSWRVDTTPPTTHAVRESPRYSTSRTVAIAVNCSGEIDPCQHCWELGADTGCSTNDTLLLTAGDDGDNTVLVAAKDSAGLLDTTPIMIEFSSDATPPQTQAQDIAGVLVPAPPALSGSAEFVVRDALRLNVTADEDLQGIQLSVGGVTSVVVGPVVDVGTLLEGVPTMITVAGVDLAGNVDTTPETWRVMLDSIPPQTTLSRVPPSPTNASTSVVGVAASDAGGGSGVRHVTVTAVDLGGGSGLSAVLFGGVGEVELYLLICSTYNVSVVAEDAAGNTDPSPPWFILEADFNPPTSSFVLAPPAFGPAAVVAVVGVDEPDAWGYARVLQGSAATPWKAVNASGGVVFNVTVDGECVMEARSIDAAGNEEGEPYTQAGFVVDTIAPQLSWAVAPLSNTVSPSWTACVNAVDATDVVFTTDAVGGVLSDVTPSRVCLTATAPADGTYTATVVAADAAGNPAELSHTWTLDREAPTTTILQDFTVSVGCVVRTGVTVCSDAEAATIRFECSDGLSPCQPQHSVEALVLQDTACAASGRRLMSRLLADGFQDSPPATPFSLLPEDASDGQYQVVLRALDAAGNPSANNVTLVWFVDTKAPPTPTLDTAPETVTTANDAVFRLRLVGDSSPGQSQFYYSLDSGPAVAVTDLPAPPDNSGVVTVTLTVGQGTHTVLFWARDQAGNEDPVSASAFHSWTAASEAPAIVVAAQPAAVSGDSTPDFMFRAQYSDGGAALGATELQVQLAPSEPFTAVTCSNLPNATHPWCEWSTKLTTPGVQTMSFRAAVGGAVGEAQPVVWTYALCADDEYAVIGDNLAILCEPCPTGANCVGGLTTQADLVALPGFWASEASSGLRYYECITDSNCLGGSRLSSVNNTDIPAQRAVCAEGYTGRMCVSCVDGYYEQLGLCSKCPDRSGTTAYLVTALVTLAMLGSGIGLFMVREFLPVDEVKIAISMGQVLATVRTSLNVEWPTTFDGMLGGFRVFLMDFVSLSQAGCATKVVFYTKFVVSMVGFKVLVFLVLLRWFIKWLKSVKRHRREVKGVNSVMGAVAYMRRRSEAPRAERKSGQVAASDPPHHDRPSRSSIRKVVDTTTAVQYLKQQALPVGEVNVLPPSEGEFKEIDAEGRPPKAPQLPSAWTAARSVLSESANPLSKSSSSGAGGGIRMGARRSMELAAPPSKQASPTPTSPTAVDVRLPESRRKSHMVLFGTTLPAIPWNEVARSVFMLLFLMYTGVSLQIAKVFDCVQVEDEWWLAVDLEVPCYDRKWGLHAAYATTMAVLYTAGFPITILVILRRHRDRLSDSAVLAKWGFLYKSYGVQAYGWEVEELLRKLWLSCLIILFPQGSPVQLATAVLVCFWAHVLHGTYKPFVQSAKKKHLYYLSHLALAAIGFIYLGGTLLAAESIVPGTTAYLVLEVLMLTFCGVFIASLVYELVQGIARHISEHRLRRRMRKLKARTAAVAAFSPPVGGSGGGDDIVNI